VVWLTRLADPKIKDSLHVRSRSSVEERIICDLKRLAVQDGVELADLVFEGILLMFHAHHWPPGNPQLPLSVFQNLQTLTNRAICKCGRPVKVWITYLPENRPMQLCEKCFTKLPLRYDPKLYHNTKKDMP